MKQADLIEESNSPYSSPVVCVHKPNGSLRVCINFRMVNLDIVNDAYPMHQIDEQLEAMACRIESHFGFDSPFELYWNGRHNAGPPVRRAIAPERFEPRWSIV